MKMDFKHYVRKAQVMLDDDRDKVDEYDSYHDMYSGDWKLPDELNDVPWMRATPSGDPYDAIAAGTRVLSAVFPRIKKIPLSPTEDNRKKANEWEKNLIFQLKAADRRRNLTTVQEVVLHALKYGEICAMVVDLEWQLEQAKLNKQPTQRIENAKKVSRFLVNIHDPRDVHVRRSDYGTEAVLLVKKRRASEVMDEWGKSADGLQTLLDWNEWITYYDYIDHETRCVWCEFDSSAADTQGLQVESANVQVVLLEPTEHKLGFLPWIAVKGGEPMLYSLLKTGNWDTQNIVRSIYVSMIIRNAGQPSLKEEGTNVAQNTDINRVNDDIVKVAPGNTLNVLQPPPPDQALADVDDRISAQTEKSTVSRVLQGGDMKSGTSFSALNLLTQTAIGALKPAQKLAERALAEACKMMLLWVEHTKKDLEAYGVTKRIDMGVQYVIKADEVSSEDVFIEVELTPDAPTDRMQRANAAGQMVQWGYPKEYALEDVGVENPLEAMDLWYLEKQKEHVFGMMQQQQIMQMQMQIQQMQVAQEQAVMAQQAQQAQQAEAQMMAQQGALMQGGGMGNAPPMGGQPPMMNEPGAQTAEQVGGMDQAGNPLAEFAGM